jgi:two-component system sensor histidine kinase KdpD
MGGRGSLRIYLGVAPGVGKTYAMLDEAHRRLSRGADLVIGLVETHGRPHTEALVEGIELVPRRELTHRGSVLSEMDLDAVLARKPAVALVDEYAHSNAPGTRNEKRWQDVEELLDAGIDVISTMNIQHLESLNDVVRRITGVPERETVPDEMVRRADQIQLVDMTPEALRRRMAHGNIYKPEKVDAALANYFRIGNLTALRELALLWVADQVEQGLARYRDEHGITTTWETRERVVVGLTGGPEGDTLIRRAARIAAASGASGKGDLLAVRVTKSDGLTDGTLPEVITRQRALVESLGGTYHQVVGDDVPTALLEFAQGVNATQIVLGTSRRRGWQYISGPGVGQTVTRHSGDIDVHIVSHERAGKGRGLGNPANSPLSARRKALGWALAVLGSVVLTLVLSGLRSEFDLASDLMLFMALTIVVALAGGLWPAVAAAVFGSLLLNYFFTPPLHTMTIGTAQNAFGLVVFVACAMAVSSVVDLAARRAKQATRLGAEAETLSLLATSVLRGEKALPALLDRVRETFAVSCVSLLEQRSDGRWAVIGETGPDPARTPDEADVQAPVDDMHVLALRGRVLAAADRRVLTAFASQAAAAIEWRRLSKEAHSARRMAEGNKIRTALLAAVSHDLRTPLASIKASVSSLRQPDIEFDPCDEAELLATIEESADRLNGLIGNLLDMSRLQTGVVVPRSRLTNVDEVLPLALAAVPEERVRTEIADSLPPVEVDTGLLERSLANVVENAVRYSPDPVLITASALTPPEGGGRLELRVVDTGPGVSDAAKEEMFAPFQRLGDAPRGNGVGLGLAVARGFMEAMGGSLTPEDTPGGGLTMVFTLPLPPSSTLPEITSEVGSEVGSEVAEGSLGEHR